MILGTGSRWSDDEWIHIEGEEKKIEWISYIHHCFCAFPGCFLGVLGFEEHTTIVCISKRSMTSLFLDDALLFRGAMVPVVEGSRLKWTHVSFWGVFTWNEGWPCLFSYFTNREGIEIRISLYKTIFWVTSPFTRPSTSTSWNSREKHVMPWLWCKGVYFFCDECILLE